LSGCGKWRVASATRYATVPHCISSLDIADSTSTYTGSTGPPLTSVQSARQKKRQSHFLGNCPATAELRNNIFTDYYLDFNYMFNKYNITTIINYTNLTNRFNKPEDSDQTGVT
jgi:hypothetical protein